MNAGKFSSKPSNLHLQRYFTAFYNKCLCLDHKKKTENKSAKYCCNFSNFLKKVSKAKKNIFEIVVND